MSVRAILVALLTVACASAGARRGKNDRAAASAGSVAPGVSPDVSTRTLLFREAKRLADPLAFNHPGVYCLALAAPMRLEPSRARFPFPLTDELHDPDSAVVSTVRADVPLARPRSECFEGGAAAPYTTRSYRDSVSIAPGIVLWIRDPLSTSDSTARTEVGYDENDASAAVWVCTLRRAAAAWVLDGCRLFVEA